MEVCINQEQSKNDNLPKKSLDLFIITTSNWKIDNDKSYNDCVSTVSLSQAPESTNLEDVVSLDTCVALQSDPSGESCKLDFKITNKQKIARIAIVSEASVLEFFKQSGEYATTIVAEFVDEFQDQTAYFAEAKIQPPSTEASIKFTRTNYKGTSMWIYGVKLILTESVDSSKNMFDLDVLNSFMSNTNKDKSDRAEMAKKVLESFANIDHGSTEDMNTYLQKFAALNFNPHRLQRHNKTNEFEKVNNMQRNAVYNGDSGTQIPLDLKEYIDKKFSILEKRLIERIEVMDQNTTQRLDAILKKLELNSNDK